MTSIQDVVLIDVAKSTSFIPFKVYQQCLNFRAKNSQLYFHRLHLSLLKRSMNADRKKQIGFISYWVNFLS